MTPIAPDLSFVHFVREVLDALEETGIQHLVGGAVAVWAWGEARTTRDLDLVIDLPIESMPALSAALANRHMLLPIDIMLDILIQSRSDLPLAVMHMRSGYKAEFFLLRPGDEQRRLALERRQLVDFGPPLGQVWVHAPEDLILYKLRFFAVSQQTKHVRDVATVMLTVGEKLDREYIESWAEQLNLTDAWQELQEEIARL